MSQRVTIPEFKALLKDSGYPVSTVTRKIAKEISQWYDVCIPSNLFNTKKSRGVFKLVGATARNVDRVFYPDTKAPKKTKAKKQVKSDVVAEKVVAVAKDVKSELTTVINDIAFSFAKNHFVPEKDPFYVKWSSLHDDLSAIYKSGHFFPTYITGLSGNGKTLTPTQVGAILKREVVRINFTEETSEDDLLGSFRLINGDTVWEDGPVVVALKRGAVLILDELDLGGSRVMCLQSVLEGKGVYIKKINCHVYPEDGFNVVATGNTKGKGDDGHGFTNVNFLNEAMLDRFSITFEQDYPTESVETKILKRAFEVFTGKKATAKDEDFFNLLAKTGTMIRENYLSGGIEGLLSTRRLVDVIKTYTVFNKDRAKAFELCTNRFDADTSGAMRELYKAVDNTVHGNDGQSEGLAPSGGNV